MTERKKNNEAHFIIQTFLLKPKSLETSELYLIVLSTLRALRARTALNILSSRNIAATSKELMLLTISGNRKSTVVDTTIIRSTTKLHMFQYNQKCGSYLTRGLGHIAIRLNG